jgi:hypothetical protein
MSERNVLRRIAGAIAVGIALLPNKAWEWAWELVRARLGEAALHWLEEHLSFGLVEEYSGVLWRIVLILVAGWLWWPTIRERVPLFAPRLIPLDDAAQQAYETAEREGLLPLISTANPPSGPIMDHFKCALLVSENLQWFGVRPPSTQLLRIPAKVVRHLYPTDVKANSLSTVIGQKPVYTNVAIRQRGLRSALKAYIREMSSLRNALDADHPSNGTAG